MIKFDILNRWSGKVQFTAEIDCDGKARHSLKIGLAVQWAVKNNADLSGADLSGADLSGAYLSRANLSRANLSRANLSRANLSRADLSRAYLSGANLSGAYLSGAYLSRAYLSRADLLGADLSGADLSGADLSGADLLGADLSGAYLLGAYLLGAKNSPSQWPHFQIPDGDLIVWKKVQHKIVKLRVPPEAKRTASLIGRKCRAEFVDVLEIEGDAPVTSDCHGPPTIYAVGERVTPDSYDDNPKVECSNGIHFFLTRAEAEEW